MKALFEIIRAMRLTNAAKVLQTSNEKIVDVAINNGFDSHDGFSRAFIKQFRIDP